MSRSRPPRSAPCLKRRQSWSNDSPSRRTTYIPNPFSAPRWRDQHSAASVNAASFYLTSVAQSGWSSVPVGTHGAAYTIGRRGHWSIARVARIAGVARIAVGGASIASAVTPRAIRAVPVGRVPIGAITGIGSRAVAGGAVCAIGSVARIAGRPIAVRREIGERGRREAHVVAKRIAARTGVRQERRV